jgi:hypothetical protein
MSVPFNGIRVIPTPTQSAVGQVDFAAKNDAFAVSLASPDTLAANVVFRLPPADGTAGQMLQTNGARVLSFAPQNVAAFAGPVTGATYAPQLANPALTMTDLNGMAFTSQLHAGHYYQFECVLDVQIGTTGTGGTCGLTVGFGGTGATVEACSGSVYAGTVGALGTVWSGGSSLVDNFYYYNTNLHAFLVIEPSIAAGVFARVHLSGRVFIAGFGQTFTVQFGECAASGIGLDTTIGSALLRVFQ